MEKQRDAAGKKTQNQKTRLHFHENLRNHWKTSISCHWQKSSNIDCACSDHRIHSALLGKRWETIIPAREHWAVGIVAFSVKAADYSYREMLEILGKH